MRVLHINLSKGWRGGERQTLLLMEGLRTRGVDSVLVAPLDQPLAKRAVAAGFETVRSGGVAWLRARADLVHAHEARALTLAALWKAVHRRPLVATRRVVFRPNGRMATRLKYRAADRIVAISRSVARVMTEWGVPPDRVRVVYSAVATDDQSRPDRVGDIRARFPGKRIIGTIGAFTSEKDHETLLRAARRVLEARPDTVFVLLGDGELRARLEAQVADFGVDRIIFEGFQDDPYSYLRAFDAFAITSREEGLGSSILDAFLYGVPVVATSAGGIPEMVDNGVSGMLCPIGDDFAIAQAINTVLADETLADRLRAGARRRLLEDFTADRMTDGYVAVYSELLRGESGAA